MKRNIYDQSIKKRKQKLRDFTFHKVKIKLQKDFLPWMTLGIKKVPKIKHRLSENFLKLEPQKVRQSKKKCKNLFGSIKRKK